MANEPRFLVVPPMRCWHQRGHPPTAPCGLVASWMQPGDREGYFGFRCGLHRLYDDVRIEPGLPFRLITVTLDVLLAAIGEDEARAHAEVVARLEQTIQRLGGLVNLHVVRSVVGRPATQAPESTANEVGGEG
jgi:hypothetical protein